MGPGPSDPSQAPAPASGVRHPVPVQVTSPPWDVRRERAGAPPWLGWCAAIGLFVAIFALVLSTLLELTREMLELGHTPASAGVQER
jgi:hypothetical protein